MLTNEKSSYYSGRFGSGMGCPKFFSFDRMRLTVVVENGAKTALIVWRLAHLGTFSLCQWTSWLNSYSWKTVFTFDRNMVNPYFKTRIKCCHAFVFYWAYTNQLTLRVGPFNLADLRTHSHVEKGVLRRARVAERAQKSESSRTSTLKQVQWRERNWASTAGHAP